MTSVHPYAVPRNPAGQSTLPPSRAPSRNGHSSPSLAAPLPPNAAGRSPALQQRPLMDRMPSTFGDTPVATNSALNKVATASSSIYQNCRTVRERLLRVPEFEDRFFSITASADVATNGSYGGTASPLVGSGWGREAEGGAGVQVDPVSQVLSVLRLGSSLCYLFNQLGHQHQLDVNPLATLNNLKACQRGAAHYIMACKQDLKWPEGDLFAVNELYGQDTNGVVKVVHSVSKLLDLLDAQGVLLPPSDPEPTTSTAGPSDERGMIVREILDSERKYMQDLDVLQDYQRQVQMNDVLTQDQIHSLFINLNKLADFQRRFLIGVEQQASLPPEQQRFGLLFIQMEDNFVCYEPYCANLTTAQDLAIAENAALSTLSHVLDPVSELAPLLIKPVQRICKYPLLISSLLKNTPSSFPHYDELKAGLESIMRVTDKVNEEKRRKDNQQAVADLANRVEDWKGHDIASFGELLLQETFVVIKSENEREYNVYLFERIILCCKEVGATGKKDKKSNSILKRPPSQRINKLQLKGRIFVNNITGAAQVNHRSGQYLLEVRWRGDLNEEAFIIKCRTQELLQQWQKAVNKAVEEAPQKRRAHHLSASRRSERSIHSPNSQFPNTPMSEYGPMLSSAGSIYSHHSSSAPGDGGAYSPYAFPGGNPAQPSYPPGHGPPHPAASPAGFGFGFDDDGTDDVYEPSESGRSTPASSRRGPGTRSLPAEQRDPSSSSSALARPRAQTEDSNSNLINQWRSQGQVPGQNGAPNLPGHGGPSRGMSQHSSTGSDAQSLRSSASSRQLRSKQSSEFGGGAGGVHPMTASPAMGYARLPGQHQEYGDEGTPRGGGGQGGALVYRQASHGQVPSQYANGGAGPGAPPMLRNRSASSPNIYQQQPNGRFGDSPQLPDQPYAADGAAYGRQGSGASTVKAGGSSRGNGGTNSGGTIASASSVSTGHKKRFSSSSVATDRSSATSAHSGSALPYSSATSPASTAPPVSAGLPPPLPGHGRVPGLPHPSASRIQQPLPPPPSSTSASQQPPTAANAVRVKVFFGEDTFVIVCLDSILYPDLLDKVLKKIRMCGGDKARIEASALRLRYKDEDGDRILITSEEDTAMAFETARGMAVPRGDGGQAMELVLFASVDGQSA
ncbi:hypothetical protein JCM8547_001522 [Rhodosporidiobolus lusitaniae]